MANDVLPLSINLPFLDDLYAQFQADPDSVDPSWKHLFQNGISQVTATNGTNGSNGTSDIARLSATLPMLAAAPAAPLSPVARADFAHASQIFGLVNVYRVRGHLEAELDPLDHMPRWPHPDLDPRTHGFTDADLDTIVPAGGLYGATEAPLREILRRLRTTYCGFVGIEMMHISAIERRAWLQERVEPTLNKPSIDRDTQLYMLELAAAAEMFESFVHTKYVGTKRFSLEGGESLIPLLELALERAAAQETSEVVLGMAHRGRLNVLHHILGKSAGDIFAEFEDINPESMFGGGDVKYHLGFSSDRVMRSGKKLHLSLAFNPSHLEAVDPVVIGRVRAKQRRVADYKHDHVLGILIHGDAAFAGQGLVAETLNLSNLKGYRTGGTLHVIVNNQIGFTTMPQASRSTTYCTDIAKTIQAPIFHVNGDEPEAVAQVVQLAMDYRREFHSDVVIDMFCYRKYGHNEGDEPAFTQPLLYQKIDSHPPVHKIYANQLIGRSVVTREEVNAMLQRRHDLLNAEFARVRNARPKVSALGGYWTGFTGGPDASAPDVATSVPRERLQEIGVKLSTPPEGFRAHPKVVKLLALRAQMANGEQPIDWGMGEALAFGSLCWDGHLVRVSGQDSRRGTFSHRHSVIVDQRTQAEYTPLDSLHDKQGRFLIYDSPLSEAAVLGFDFGYSLDYPDGLIIWEAQFGDFVNGAQVIIDQFITSAEDKWQRLSGLVLLLPHGFEGQGPEHSSARFERFLEACAEDNIQVCYPTTPAQYFHLLRRQLLRKWRKPLIVMTPKGILRAPAARSDLSEFVNGKFQRILFDPEPPPSENVERVVLCTGKIYYELVEERRKRKDERTAIVRIEQLYPLSDHDLAQALDNYEQADEVVWVQEEPSNMGANHYIYVRLLKLVGHRSLHTVTRAESASPATGSNKAHQIEQQQILQRAFAPVDQLEDQ